MRAVLAEVLGTPPLSLHTTALGQVGRGVARQSRERRPSRASHMASSKAALLSCWCNPPSLTPRPNPSLRVWIPGKTAAWLLTVPCQRRACQVLGQRPGSGPLLVRPTQPCTHRLSQKSSGPAWAEGLPGAFSRNPCVGGTHMHVDIGRFRRAL